MDVRLPERYTEIAPLARGGMGVVYRAEDAVLGRSVAIKVLADRYAADGEVRRRFTREALTAARVSGSPHTVTVYDVGEEDGRPFIVMELARGGSLADRIAAGGAPSAERALAWLRQAAGALDAAHAHGVVHRDVKPANLLLDEHGEVRVADFGIASARGLDSLTLDGTVLGTAGYLAPEQARGERATPASDRYALGVVAFELLTGRRPFERESPPAEAAAHAGEPVPRASELVPLPPAVDAVLERALAKAPEDRFPSATAFAEALAAALGERGDAPAAAATSHRGARGRPALAAAAAALLLAGAGGLAVLAGEEEAEQSPATTAAQGRQPEPELAGDAWELNDAGWRRMRAGDLAAALPLLERALELSRGSGERVEAFAAYNVAYTRFQLGRCEGVLELLDRSQSLQRPRREIAELRARASERC